mgnify:CR=1 FL=1
MPQNDISSVSMNELAEEFVEQIVSSAHYESVGNGDMRLNCRNEAITIFKEILSRRVTVSTTTNLFSKE